MLIIGLQGQQPSPEECEWLRHPAVAGVILFSRNCAEREQLADLVQRLRNEAGKPLLVTVDQEGGRVQRCQQGFTRLPELAWLGELDAQDSSRAEQLTREHGWLMAAELRAVGIDMSFAPVLDLGRGNRAIGDRALSPHPAVTSRLGKAYIQGMAEAGMAACAKHFPGHGSVIEDTHHESASDARDWPTLEAEDLQPFVAAFAAGVESVMMAHVSYPRMDAEPAGYSTHWIQTILRQQLGFEGVVISDDIGMAAAGDSGQLPAQRVNRHLDAGCDVVLVCDPAQVEAGLQARKHWQAAASLSRLSGRPALDHNTLVCSPRYLSACQWLAKRSSE